MIGLVLAIGGIAVDPRRGAIVAGGHHFMETPIGDEVIAYALPRSR